MEPPTRPLRPSSPPRRCREPDRRRTGPVRGRGGVAASLVLAVGLALVPSPTSAQACTPADPGDGPSPDRVDRVDPPWGPGGASVEVHDRDLPVRATVHLAMGQVGGAGYQVGDPLETTPTGELDGTVAVPDWATSDRALFVMVFSDQFRPIAFSGPFHVTDREGRVQRSGTLVELAGGCLGLEGNDATYALTGDAAEGLRTRVGERVGVEARPGAGACGCADVLEVEGTGASSGDGARR